MNRIKSRNLNKKFFIIGITITFAVFLTSSTMMNNVIALPQPRPGSGETCEYNEDNNSETCCEWTPNPTNPLNPQTWTCTTCLSVNLETGAKSGCAEVNEAREILTEETTNVPQNDGVLVEPKTPSKGNNAATTPNNDGVLEQTPLSSSSLSNSDNLGQVNDATKKGNSLNDNSPTPPACPKEGPIPPDCTLKPKF